MITQVYKNPFENITLEGSKRYMCTFLLQAMKPEKKQNWQAGQPSSVQFADERKSDLIFKYLTPQQFDRLYYKTVTEAHQIARRYRIKPVQAIRMMINEIYADQAMPSPLHA